MKKKYSLPRLNFIYFSALTSLLLWSGIAAKAQTETYSTTGSFTSTVPAGVNQVTIECWGGGGAGAKATGGTVYGGGGGGGAYSKTINLGVTAGSTLTISVGAGGNG